jgi:hypothetical protein
MFRKLALAAVLATTAGAESALAEVVERRQVNQWVLEANYGNGALQNCSIKASYGAGAEVLFMVTRDVKWGMGVRNASWNLNTGNKGQVRYWVDQHARRTATATAINRNLLAVPLADSKQLFDEIRWGNVLYFTVDRDTFNMTLKGTAVALDQLLNCVQRHR